MGFRRKARELALQILYAHEITKEPAAVVLENLKAGDEEERIEATPFSEALVNNSIGHCEEIDAILAKAITNWSIGRLAIVDKNILRLAVVEIVYMDDIPSKVTINEYIEIAKRYGDEDSPAFVNGVLDKVGRIARLDSQNLAEKSKSENSG